MRYKSRKFWIAVFLILIATMLVYLGKLDSSKWVDLVKWIGSTYFFANAFNKFARVKSGSS